jgi:hypothetical protein
LEELLLSNIDHDIYYNNKDLEIMNLFENQLKNDIDNEFFPNHANNDDNDGYNNENNYDKNENNDNNKNKKEIYQEKINKINFNEKLPYTVLSTINSLQYIEIISSKNNEFLSPDSISRLLILSLKTIVKSFLLLRKLIFLYMNLSMILKYKKKIEYIYEDYNLKNTIYILFNQVLDTCTQICKYTCVCMYMCLCIYICTYEYAFMYICAHTYTFYYIYDYVEMYISIECISI